VLALAFDPENLGQEQCLLGYLEYTGCFFLCVVKLLVIYTATLFSCAQIFVVHLNVKFPLCNALELALVSAVPELSSSRGGSMPCAAPGCRAAPSTGWHRARVLSLVLAPPGASITPVRAFS